MTYPFPIRDYPGYGDPIAAVGIIRISGAPPDATVTCIDVGSRVNHSRPSDLVILLTHEHATTVYPLWEMDYGSPGDFSRTRTGITAFNGELVNQRWLIVLADLIEGDTGDIDSWWIKVYYEAEMLNDDCANAIAVEEGIPYQGNTVGATGIYESSCSFNDTADVWHSYTPTNTGLVTISLAGSKHI